MKKRTYHKLLTQVSTVQDFVDLTFQAVLNSHEALRLWKQINEKAVSIYCSTNEMEDAFFTISSAENDLRSQLYDNEQQCKSAIACQERFTRMMNDAKQEEWFDSI